MRSWILKKGSCWHIGTKNLCYYRHTKSIAEGPVDNKCNDDNETGESEVEACESCGEMFDEVEDLIDHYGTTGHLMWRKYA